MSITLTTDKRNALVLQTIKPGQQVTYRGGFDDTVVAEVIEVRSNGSLWLRPLHFIENGQHVELTEGQRQSFSQKGGVSIWPEHLL